MPAPADQLAVIMLAAGYSRRFGGDKRLAGYDGGTLLEAALARVPDSFTVKVLVLHPGDEGLPLRAHSGWQICMAANAALGMGHSIAAGIEALSELADGNRLRGTLIGLGDMPFVRPETYGEIGELLLKHEIVAPVFEGRRGNPVGFAAKYFDELAALTGDRGARDLLNARPASVHQYETRDRGVLRDIDTRAALAAAAKRG